MFAAILDPEDGGRFAVRPTGQYDASHEYVDRTNVLETTFETDDGTATVTDFMPVTGAEALRDSNDDELERDGDSADEQAQQAIYRNVTGVSGSLDLDVVFEPRFDYARSPIALEYDENGDVVALGAGRVGKQPREVVPGNDRTHDHEPGSLYLTPTSTSRSTRTRTSRRRR